MVMVSVEILNAYRSIRKAHWVNDGRGLGSQLNEISTRLEELLKAAVQQEIEEEVDNEEQAST